MCERETQNSSALILFRVTCDREKLGQTFKIQLGINNAILNEWDFTAKTCMWIQWQKAATISENHFFLNAIHTVLTEPQFDSSYRNEYLIQPGTEFTIPR